MTSKIFQANHQNWWLNIEVVGAGGLVTGPLELAVIVRMVAPAIGLSMFTGVAWCIWGPKAKIDHLVLDAKLLLINMNYVEFFLFLEIL